MTAHSRPPWTTSSAGSELEERENVRGPSGREQDEPRSGRQGGMSDDLDPRAREAREGLEPRDERVERSGSRSVTSTRA